MSSQGREKAAARSETATPMAKQSHRSRRRAGELRQGPIAHLPCWSSMTLCPSGSWRTAHGRGPFSSIRTNRSRPSRATRRGEVGHLEEDDRLLARRVVLGPLALDAEEGPAAEPGEPPLLLVRDGEAQPLVEPPRPPEIVEVELYPRKSHGIRLKE
jgi:hypothetical protein